MNQLFSPAFAMPLLWVAGAMILMSIITPLVIGFGFKRPEYAEWHPEERKPEPVGALVEPVTTNTMPDGIAIVEALFRERR